MVECTGLFIFIIFPLKSKSALQSRHVCVGALTRVFVQHLVEPVHVLHDDRHIAKVCVCTVCDALCAA